MAKKADYGRGHPNFVEYMTRIVNDPNYKGMPDVFLDDEGIQWEAPSNRTGGKFKDTHHKRRHWWELKAKERGISTSSSMWISRTAKTIHPTKLKPCKKCGRILDIRYKYPSGIFLKRLLKAGWIVSIAEIEPFSDISKIISDLTSKHGQPFLNGLLSLLEVKSIPLPTDCSSLGDWLKWIEETYVPGEPSTLSPGAMSNAPDRLDGFHSFNICCRSTADRGRSRQNLASYVTDRRVFEYWVDGDWVAADRMMGFVRSDPLIQSSTCLNGHSGPCSADHIGPLSLGFTHRPEFQLLCAACNSAKNNRMTRKEVVHLIEKEKSGDLVISWYAKELWDNCKGLVDSDETALRLSKLLRDNRHCAVFFLCEILKQGHLTFLSTLLGLNFADREPLFQDLKIINHKTNYEKLDFKPRTVKYALEQKARRLRIAFGALGTYFEKDSRNFYLIEKELLINLSVEISNLLKSTLSTTREIDKRLAKAIKKGEEAEVEFRKIAECLVKIEFESATFHQATQLMKSGMKRIGRELAKMWTHERYVRSNENVL